MKRLTHLKSLIALFVALYALSLAGCQGEKSKKESNTGAREPEARARVDRDLIKQTVDNCATALLKKDVDQIARNIKGASKALVERAIAHIDWSNFQISSTVSDVKVDSMKATAIVKTTIVMVKSKSKQEVTETVLFENDGEVWQIICEDPARTEGFYNKIAFMSTEHRSSRTAGRPAGTSNPSSDQPRSECFSKIKQCAMGVMMFSTDNDDKLPPKAKDWHVSVLSFVKNNSVFTCPSDPEGTISFSYNPWLAGKAITAVPRPATIVLLYEGKNGKLDFRHDGKAAVAFLDGHAEMVDASRAEKLEWKQ